MFYASFRKAECWIWRWIQDSNVGDSMRCEYPNSILSTDILLSFMQFQCFHYNTQEFREWSSTYDIWRHPGQIVVSLLPHRVSGKKVYYCDHLANVDGMHRLSSLLETGYADKYSTMFLITLYSKSLSRLKCKYCRRYVVMTGTWNLLSVSIFWISRQLISQLFGNIWKVHYGGLFFLQINIYFLKVS